MGLSGRFRRQVGQPIHFPDDNVFFTPPPLTGEEIPLRAVVVAFDEPTSEYRIVATTGGAEFSSDVGGHENLTGASVDVVYDAPGVYDWEVELVHIPTGEIVDTESGQIEVFSDAPQFEVADVSSDPSPGRQQFALGEELTVEVVVENSGVVGGDFTSELRVGGEVVSERTVEIEAGGEVAITHTIVFEQTGSFGVVVDGVTVGVAEVGDPYDAGLFSIRNCHLSGSRVVGGGMVEAAARVDSDSFRDARVTVEYTAGSHSGSESTIVRSGDTSRVEHEIEVSDVSSPREVPVTVEITAVEPL